MKTSQNSLSNKKLLLPKQIEQKKLLFVKHFKSIRKVHIRIKYVIWEIKITGAAQSNITKKYFYWPNVKSINKKVYLRIKYVFFTYT